MLRYLSIAAIALAAVPGLAVAQQPRVAVDQYGRPISQPMPAQPAMPTQSGPVDPNGRPYVMSPPQPTPGDPGYGAPAQRAVQSQGSPTMNSPANASQAMASGDSGGTIRDEYGMLYNSRGDRVDRAGRILPPPVTPPGARALR
jgi:hypothetical protein